MQSVELKVKTYLDKIKKENPRINVAFDINSSAAEENLNEMD